VPRKGKAARARRGAGANSGADANLMPAPDQELLARLKAGRAAQAREQSVPAYVILHDSTLAAIAAAPPQDLDAMAAIAGIGARKLERYGPALLQLLRG